MSSNIRFTQNGQMMFGSKFGYAIVYELTDIFGNAHVSFKEKLIMAEDPQNCKKPMPTDLAAELLFELTKEKTVIAHIYGKRIVFTEKQTLFEVKKRIREVQRSLIKVDLQTPSTVQNYLKNHIFELIKYMPVC